MHNLIMLLLLCQRKNLHFVSKSHGNWQRNTLLSGILNIIFHLKQPAGEKQCLCGRIISGIDQED